jgi:spermidine export protein MdtJ
MRYFLFLFSAVIINAGSSLFYKFSSLNSQRRTLSLALLMAGLGLGSINAFLYTKSLEGIALNTAYPLFSAGSILLVSILALGLFHESLSVQKALGMGIIVIGVALVSR